uniref:ribonuclease H n=1 Tax=Biomphalaria glabrata TaxID=6526 RepID=A0A2C9M4E0_BIOGL
MEYSSLAQVYASQTSLAGLDSTQNQAIRLICGAFRTTPTAACEVMTNLPPLRLRRERAVMIAYEKFKRLEECCPVRSLVDNWQGGNRRKRNSFMHSVRELSKEVELPQNRAALALHGASSPANAPGVPEVRKSLIDPEVNKKCTKTVLRNTARKTVAQYPTDSIKVYTDGSTRENLGQKTSGYGVVVRFPGSTENNEILGACSGRSNYVAEMVAIQNAVEYIEERLNEKTAQPSPIVLFTDALSSLQAIESPADTLPEPLAKTLACVGRLQEKHEIRTTFQYVPGHVDVEGNTKADLLAKLGTKLDPVDEPQTFEQARAIVDELARDKWCKSWENGNTGREVWQNLKGPSKSDEWWQLNREEQVTIA